MSGIQALAAAAAATQKMSTGMPVLTVLVHIFCNPTVTQFL
jgi:hypothetical protein